MSTTFGSSRRIQGLSAPEVRVLGCLLEKQRTTPDQYPLSLNALRLACNQSTNRDPVVEYDESAIRDALHRLERRALVRLASGAGSRAAKYRHLLAEALPLGEGEQAILTVLMLRGAQTPGELKQRSERMHAFAELNAVHESLAAADRARARRAPRSSSGAEGGALFAAAGRRGDRARGRRERAELGCRDAARRTGRRCRRARRNGESGSGSWAAPTPQQLDRLRERVEQLEREVAELRAAMRNASASAPSMPAREIDDPRRSDPRL